MEKTKYLHCIADLGQLTLHIPGVALKISNFEGQTQAEYRPLDDVIVVLKRQMTAAEMINAIQQLSDTASDLMAGLAEVCRPCDECACGCLCCSSEDSPLCHVPPELLLTLAESGICLGELEDHLIMEDIVYGK